MPTLLHNLAFFEHATTALVQGVSPVEVRHHQILLWVSVTPPGLPEPPPRTPRFPAVLDTGFNDTFLIQGRHLRGWAGASPPDYGVLGALAAYGQRVPLLDADVWLHPNRPGHRDEFAHRPPFRLQLDTGIGVCPDRVNAPRLPLLGMRALTQNRLVLKVDCRRCRVVLRPARWFWFFG